MELEFILRPYMSDKFLEAYLYLYIYIYIIFLAERKKETCYRHVKTNVYENKILPKSKTIKNNISSHKDA